MIRKISTCSIFIIFVMLCLQASNAFGQVSVNGKSHLETVCPDKTKEPCATAKKMIESAAVIVLGEELGADEWTYTANNMLSSSEVGEEKFKDGLKLMDAANFWKSYIASPFSGDGTRTKVINNAFLEVYGVLPLAIESKVWMAKIKVKQAWYTTIVAKEISNMNSAPIRRQDVITRAYKHAFGRVPNDGDMKYWLPRTEHYRLLIAAQRVWLYSPNGVNDLQNVVKMVLYAKNKKEPLKSDIDAAIKKFAANKLIYIEMVKAA